MQREIDKKAARENEGEYSAADWKKMEEFSKDQRRCEGQLRPPKFIAEDATQEALAEALSTFDESLMLYSTDAGKLISNLLGRYSPSTESGILREDTLLLEGYSVESTVIDRVSRSTTLDEPCLTTLWMVQPSKIPLLFGDEGLCDGGFMPRMMPCVTPGGLPERSPQLPIDSEIEGDWKWLISELFKLRKHGGGVKSGSCVEFQVSEEASQIWFEWDNSNRRETKAGNLGDVSGFVSRWGEWAQRVAVLLQAAKYVEDRTNKTISRETMEAAIEIATWFTGEQLRILHAGRVATREAKLEQLKQRGNKLEEILKGSVGERSLSDLERRNGFSGEEIKALAAKFPERFEIREKPTSTKPAIVCVLK